MSDKVQNTFYQKNLCALFASTSLLAFGALSLLNNFSMDTYSIIFMLKIAVPASLSLGFLGYAIGKMLDSNEKTEVQTQANNPNNQKDAYKIESMFVQNSEEQDETKQVFFDNTEDKKGEGENND